MTESATVAIPAAPPATAPLALIQGDDRRAHLINRAVTRFHERRASGHFPADAFYIATIAAAYEPDEALTGAVVQHLIPLVKRAFEQDRADAVLQAITGTDDAPEETDPRRLAWTRPAWAQESKFSDGHVEHESRALAIPTGDGGTAVVSLTRTDSIAVDNTGATLTEGPIVVWVDGRPAEAGSPLVLAAAHLPRSAR